MSRGVTYLWSVLHELPTFLLYSHLPAPQIELLFFSQTGLHICYVGCGIGLHTSSSHLREANFLIDKRRDFALEVRTQEGAYQRNNLAGY